MKIAILNSNGQPDYVCGLVRALAERSSIKIDLLDGIRTAGRFSNQPNVTVVEMFGTNSSTISLCAKIARTASSYTRLGQYLARGSFDLLHIQWLPKFELFDTLALSSFGRMQRPVVHTAHNVDCSTRNGQSRLLVRKALGLFYRRVDAIIAHTNSIREELIQDFAVDPRRVHVVPHGINDSVPRHGITQAEARQRLGMSADAKVLLFFGSIHPYKGVDLLIEACSLVGAKVPELLLLLVGSAHRQQAYLCNLLEVIRSRGLADRVVIKEGFCPEDHIEPYFAAADCVVLPHRRISQSGVPFLAYRFGNPVVAMPVGGLGETIVPNCSGFLARSVTSAALAESLVEFFSSSLYRDKDESRRNIRDWAGDLYGWHRIASATVDVYEQVLARRGRGIHACSLSLGTRSV